MTSLCSFFRLKYFQIFMATLLFPYSTGIAYAAAITLGWQPAAGTSIAGYKLFLGTESGKYTVTKDVGNSTQYTFSSLAYDTKYFFSATTYDSYGNSSLYSAELSALVASPNHPPAAPSFINAPLIGGVNEVYSFSVSATDPDGDALQFCFNWGDGAVSAWGSSLQSHTWTTTGSQCIRAQARDSRGLISDWSACQAIDIISGSSDTGSSGSGGGTAAYKIWFEAEDGNIAAPFEIGDDDQASERGFVGALNGTGNYLMPTSAAGKANYTLQIPTAGKYLVWGRVLSPSYADDSFFVSLDGSTPIRWNTPVSSAWVWDQISNANSADPVFYYLTQGTHTLEISQREDGARIDRLLLTNDASYLPDGTGEITKPTTCKIWVEAETGTVSEPMSIYFDSSAAGGAYVLAPNANRISSTPNLASGYAQLKFETPDAGDFTVWGRVLAPSWSDDSYFISIDGQPYLRWNPPVTPTWNWNQVATDPSLGPAVYHLSAGQHTIIFVAREDGTLLDKLLITNDSGYVPDGLGEASSTQIPSGDTIEIEAENGILVTPMSLATDALSSGGQYVWAPEGVGNVYAPDAGAGSVEFIFAVVQAADFMIWGRVLSSDYASDSFYLSIDAGIPMRWNTPVGPSWTWRKAEPVGYSGLFHLTPGIHKLRIIPREDGTKLDKLIISKDLSMIPE